MKAGLPVVALLLASCSVTPRTQVIVTIDAEPGVRAAAPNLHLRVLGGEGATVGPTAERFDRVLHPGTDDPGFPFSIAIAPLDHAVGRVYEITATALDKSDGFVAELRAVSGFVEGRTLHLRLVLEDACRGRTCPGETCRAGVCVDPYVDPRTLPSLGSDGGPSLDASERIDAAPDGASRLDAPPDADAPPAVDAPDPDAALVMDASPALDARDAPALDAADAPRSDAAPFDTGCRSDGATCSGSTAPCCGTSRCTSGICFPF